MIQTFQVQVYPKMGFHWKSQGLILLIVIAAGVLAKLFVPGWIVQNRLFEQLMLAAILYVLYSKYILKSYTYTREPLTISADKVNFRGVDYSKRDIGFYRYIVRGTNYGSLIKLGNEVAIVCRNMDLPGQEKYDGDFSSLKHSHLAIGQDVFDALKSFKYSAN